METYGAILLLILMTVLVFMFVVMAVWLIKEMWFDD